MYRNLNTIELIGYIKEARKKRSSNLCLWEDIGENHLKKILKGKVDDEEIFIENKLRKAYMQEVST